MAAAAACQTAGQALCLAEAASSLALQLALAAVAACCAAAPARRPGRCMPAAAAVGQPLAGRSSSLADRPTASPCPCSPTAKPALLPPAHVNSNLQFCCSDSDQEEEGLFRD